MQPIRFELHYIHTQVHIMKYLILTLIVLGTFVSCNKEADSELIGTWQLTETLIDPGDGSGTFQSVESDKIIKFKKSGKFCSNGSMCDMSTEATNSSSGTYNTSNTTITPSNCSIDDLELNYELINGYLIVYYPCYEACQMKFAKVD